MLQKINLQKDFFVQKYVLETIGMSKFIYVFNLLRKTCFLEMQISYLVCIILILDFKGKKDSFVSKTY